MKKYILLLILTFTTLNVYAEWFYVTSGETFTSFVDIESYKKTGPMVRYWELRNYKEPKGNFNGTKFHLSSKLKTEINCNTEEYQYLAIINYSENDGSGEVIDSYSSAKGFKHIVPDSTGYAIYKFVCNKK
jgi:hypothetical protein